MLLSRLRTCGSHAILDPGIEYMTSQGQELLGGGFACMLDSYGIRHSPTTIKNPQANSICERLHQTVTNALCPLLHVHPPWKTDDATSIIDSALNTAAFSA